MKSMIVLALMIMPLTVLSQQEDDSDTQDSTTCIYIPSPVPEFPGGTKAYQEYIRKNARKPGRREATGSVFVSFVVNEDGSISDAKVVKGVSVALDREAVDLVLNMPSWIPAMQDGRNLKTRITIPVKFSP